MVVSSSFSLYAPEGHFRSHPLPALCWACWWPGLAGASRPVPKASSRLARLVELAGVLPGSRGAEAGLPPMRAPHLDGGKESQRVRCAGPLHAAGVRGDPPHRGTPVCCSPGSPGREVGLEGRWGGESDRGPGVSPRCAVGASEGRAQPQAGGVQERPSEPGSRARLVAGPGPRAAGCPRANIFPSVVLIKDRIKFCVLKLEQMFVLIS